MSFIPEVLAIFLKFLVTLIMKNFKIKEIMSMKACMNVYVGMYVGGLEGALFDGLNSFRYISDDVAWWLITSLRLGI